MSAIRVDPIGSSSAKRFCPLVTSAILGLIPCDRNSVKRILFGKPRSGEVSELYRSEEKRRMKDVQMKYLFTKSENNLSPPPKDAEESLIEKEQREYNEKILQSSLVETFALKQTVLDEKYLRKIANSSCRGERVKPYPKQQASVTDYFGQRKRASRNNNSIQTSSENLTKEINEMLTNMIPHQTMQDQGLERVGNDSNSNVNSNTSIINNNTEPNISASNNTTTTAFGISNEVTEFPTPPRDHEQSQEQISLHTMK